MTEYGALSQDRELPNNDRRTFKSVNSPNDDGSHNSVQSNILINVHAFQSSEGKASVSSEIVSITKNLLGAGVLSLSGGIALYSNDPKAMLSASIWILLLGVMFAYFGVLIAKVCEKTHSLTYRECWEATHERGGLAVAVISTLLPAQGDIAYATVLSQTLRSLLETIHIEWSRVTCLLVITIFALLPLCLMKDLDALTPFSTLGVLAVIMSMMAMLFRSTDGSYAPGGRFYSSINEEIRPSFGKESSVWSLQILPFVCMVFQAWVMHYNVPKFYSELKGASIPRFRKAMTLSFIISAFMYIIIAGAGYWTFGGASQSYILNNYAPDDPLATISRVGIFISTLLIYPLAFFGVRAGCLDVLQVPHFRRTTTFLNLFSIGLLTILTLLAIFFHDLGLINAVGGGAFATFLCIIFPCLMFRRAVYQDSGRSHAEEKEVEMACIIMVVGSILGAVGVWEALSGPN